MKRLKRSCNFKANSLLESVVALSIISGCLYIAVLIYAAVFTSKTSVKYYSTQNKIDEVFFALQISHDSLVSKYDKEEWDIEEEITGNLKKVIVKHKDSVQAYPQKVYYIKQ